MELNIKKKTYARSLEYKTDTLTHPAQADSVSPTSPSSLDPASKSPDSGSKSGGSAGVQPLTRQVMLKRLARFFKPRADGHYCVSEGLVKLWHTDEGKEQLLTEFSNSGYDKESSQSFQTMFIVSNNVYCFKFCQKCNLLPVVFQCPSRR